jgi:hypothetical protein
VLELTPQLFVALDPNGERCFADRPASGVSELILKELQTPTYPVRFFHVGDLHRMIRNVYSGASWDEVYEFKERLRSHNGWPCADAVTMGDILQLCSIETSSSREKDRWQAV